MRAYVSHPSASNGSVDIPLSQQAIKFPDIITLAHSNPQPDFVVRMDKAITTVNRDIASLLGPVLVLGEAKRGVETSKKSNSQTDNKPYGQMAAGLHATMNLLVMYHYERPEGSDFEFPQDGFVYSIFYDKDEIVIFANFPALVNSNWAFFTRQVFRCSTGNHITGCDRVALIVALYEVKRQSLALEKLFIDGPPPPTILVSVAPRLIGLGAEKKVCNCCTDCTTRR